MTHRLVSSPVSAGSNHCAGGDLTLHESIKCLNPCELLEFESARGGPSHQCLM